MVSGIKNNRSWQLLPVHDGMRQSFVNENREKKPTEVFFARDYFVWNVYLVDKVAHHSLDPFSLSRLCCTLLLDDDAVI